MAERDNEGFLSRWSRLKRQPDESRENDPSGAASDEPTLPSQPDVEEFEADELPRRVLETPEEELSAMEREWLENRRRAEAVDLDAAVYESDFALFLKRGVPSALRKKALRKLWTSNPLLANLDGLNDYEENFGDPALNTFTSIWQVGRGYLGSGGLEDRADGAGEAGTVRHEAAHEEPGETGDDGEGTPAEDADDEGVEETDVDVESEGVGVEPGLDSDAQEDTAPQRVPLRRRWNLDNS